MVGNVEAVFISYVDVTGKSGQNVYSREVAAALTRRSDTQLTLICPEPTSKLPKPLDQATRLRYFSPKDSRSFTWHAEAQIETYKILRSLSNKFDFDVIATSLKASTVTPALIAKQTRTPFVLFVEGLLSQNINQLRPFLGATLLSDIISMFNVLASDSTLVAFNEVRDWLAAFPFVDSSDIKIINHGVDSELFKPVDKKLARSILDIPNPSDELIIGYVGSFKQRHRLDLLVEAMKQLADENVPLRAILIGDGELQDNIKKSISESSLSDRICFPGYVPNSDLPYYIGACDILYGVRDADHWANPLKVYEYLACNRPVIAYKTAHTEFIQNNDFGILVDETTTNAIKTSIAKAYQRLFENHNLFNDSREFIIRNYDWDYHAEAIVSNISN